MKRIRNVAISLMMVLIDAPAGAAVVVFDQWWNIDFATLACKDQNQGGSTAQCVAGLYQFEREVVSSMAAFGACKGIDVIVYNVTTSQQQPSTRADDRWSIRLDFNPGARKQRWQLFGPKLKWMLEGEDDTTRIASKLCGIVTNAGATIR